MKKIRLFISDVDGVMTDSGMYYTNSGDEFKKFNTRDGMGFELLKNNNIYTAIITSESTMIVENRAKKLKVDFLFQGQKFNGKFNAAIKLCNELNISLKEVAYIGDDINCIELLKNVGLAACPSDAHFKVKSIPEILVLNTKGGEGVVREFVEIILADII
jgi:N-acylneuraminate cytidylyltransferase